MLGRIARLLLPPARLVYQHTQPRRGSTATTEEQVVVQSVVTIVCLVASLQRVWLAVT